MQRMYVCAICLVLIASQSCVTGAPGQSRQHKGTDFQYERPELYQPSLALGKRYLNNPKLHESDPPTQSEMEAGENDEGMEIIGPSSDILAPGSGLTYNIVIRDVSADATGTPSAVVYPSNVVVAAAQKLDSTSIQLTIDGSKLAGLGSVEIVAYAASTNAPLRLSQRTFLTEPEVEIYTTFEEMTYGDTADEFGRYFASCFKAYEVNFINPSPKGVLVYGASLNADVRYLWAREDVVRILGSTAVENPELLDNYTIDDSGYNILDYLDLTEPRRVMSFSDVLAVFDYQRNANPRQRFVELMKSAGRLAAQSAVFINHTDYAAGVAMFTGVFTPELEKNLLWDILLHIQNLESRSLREVEEIPGHGNLNRVVFFPRRAIYGIIQDVPVYIAEARPGERLVNFTYIDKLGDDMRAVLAEQNKAKAEVIFDAQNVGANDPEVLRALATLEEVKARKAAEAAEKAKREAEQQEEIRAFVRKGLEASIERIKQEAAAQGTTGGGGTGTLTAPGLALPSP